MIGRAHYRYVTPVNISSVKPTLISVGITCVFSAIALQSTSGNTQYYSVLLCVCGSGYLCLYIALSLSSKAKDTSGRFYRYTVLQNRTGYSPEVDCNTIALNTQVVPTQISVGLTGGMWARSSPGLVGISSFFQEIFGLGKFWASPGRLAGNLEFRMHHTGHCSRVHY